MAMAPHDGDTIMVTAPWGTQHVGDTIMVMPPRGNHVLGTPLWWCHHEVHAHAEATIMEMPPHDGDTVVVMAHPCVGDTIMMVPPWGNHVLGTPSW